MTLAEIADITGGKVSVSEAFLHGSITNPGRIVVDGSVVTDSREVWPAGLFVARIGEHADGHDFVAAAHERGAVAALTSRPVEDLPCVVVDDVQVAFGRIARAVIDQARPRLKVVAITGSSGKTTTKDLLASVLSRHGRTVAAAESFNGEIGVPLTVCRVTEDTRFLIVEMGARGIGHLTYLTGIAPPDIGVVLNVGTAHVGEFGGRGNIARAKAELVQALRPGRVAVLNADDPAVAAMAGLTEARTVLVGESPQAAVRATGVGLDARGRPSFRVSTPKGGAAVALALHGRHHVGNALAVVAVALECGMPLDAIVAALAHARPASRWRMEVTERPDGVTVVNDAYNANPDSMAAALHALVAMSRAEDGSPRRTWAVLGEMLELGDDSVAEHARIGALAAALGVGRLVAVGGGARAVADGAQGAGTDVTWVPDVDTAYDVVQEQAQAGDVVLLKSSRDAGLRWLGERLAAGEPAT